MVRYLALKNQYNIEKTIGCGGFAKVKLATHIPTGEKVAIKIMEKSSLGDDLPRVKLEIDALKSLSHHHICQLFQVIESESHFFMVVEYCSGGELFDHIVEKNRLRDFEARCFFRQIVSAVGYLHRLGYAHRDLKPENVLLDKNQMLKLIDFGLCAKPRGGMDSHLYTSCGSPTYAAPELILGNKYLGAEIDIWSMGVLLYALLCGFLPFDDNNIESLYKRILSGKYDEPDWLTMNSKLLMRSMLQTDPRKRITMTELVKHPWMMIGFADPVEINSKSRFREKDMECIKVMSDRANISTEKMWSKIQCWNYDFDTATYLLLLSRKTRGLPVRLTRQTSMSLMGLQSPSIEVELREPISAINERFQKTYLVFNGREATPDRDLISESKKSPVSRIPVLKTGKENHKEFLEPNLLTPTQRANKRLRSPGLHELSPVPTKTTPGRSRHPGTPVNYYTRSKDKIATTPVNTPKSASKVLGSIEKGFNKVRHVLTPMRKRTKTGGGQSDKPAVLSTKDLSNVSTTSYTNPDDTLRKLNLALSAKGIAVTQRGYILRGKMEQIVDNRSNKASSMKSSKLSFELEVCLLPSIGPSIDNQNNSFVVGIRRKRLKGDAWCYKKVCEEILALASNSVQSSR